MKKLIFAFAILASLVITACSSDDNDDDSANRNKQYPVSYSLNTKQEGHLWFGDRWLAIDSTKTDTDKLGYRGLLIYADKNDKITAFDLACPNCWNGNILTQINKSTDRYECKVCGLKGYAHYGFGSFDDREGTVDFAKYKVTKIAQYEYQISNPE